MKYASLFRGLFFLGTIVLVLALTACPNPVNTDFAFEEGDGDFEISRHGGKSTPVESEFFPPSKHQKNALREFLGWTFTPTAKSEDGRLVVGNAVNVDGFSNREVRIEPGTKVAVYWLVGESHRKHDPVISLPYVIGLIDYDSIKGNWRQRAMMVAQLNGRSGLLHLDRYSIYLETAVSVADLEKKYSYEVAGTIGSETANYLATFEWFRVTAIDPSVTLSDENDILSFVFSAADNPLVEAVVAAIDGYSITATVPVGPEELLTPTIGISEAATIDPASGEEKDFSTDVVYTVTSESGLEAVYTVSVTFLPPVTSPVVFFSDANFKVVDAPDGGANGYYYPAEGLSYAYTNANGYYLYQAWYLLEDAASYWVISPSAPPYYQELSSFPEDSYVHSMTLFYANPPRTGWMEADGVTPVPGMEVLGIPFTAEPSYAVSNVPVGTALTVVYEFDGQGLYSDADTTFQWRSYSAAISDFEVITGEIGRTYTVDGSEGGRVQAQIIARDGSGNVVDSVISDQIYVQSTVTPEEFF